MKREFLKSMVRVSKILSVLAFTWVLVLDGGMVYAAAITQSDLRAIRLRRPHYAPGSGTSANGTSGCTTIALPTINNTTDLATAINKYVQESGGAGSPFDGLGSDIVEGAVRASVNPFLVVAIAKKESSFGTAGIATEGTFNAFGRTLAAGASGGKTIGSHTWYTWESWARSVNDPGGDDEAAFLKRVYAEQFGLSEIQDIINRYAPASDGNNPNGYAQQVLGSIATMASIAGASIDCGSSGGNTPGVETPPADPSENIKTGQRLAAEAPYNWTGEEWNCLYTLWQHESNWNERADNPSSSAYGIPQALPGSKMSSAGADWSTNAATQIKWGLGYIKGRPDYGSPCKAWTLWQRRSPHWY